MNFLGHAVLSFTDETVLVGNILGDFTRGRVSKLDFPKEIKVGIYLHRFIDDYTDNHPATKEAAQYFKKDYRLYSGAFIDIVYDHFLANDRQVFDDSNDLMKFSQWVYQTLGKEKALFPQVFERLFPYMKMQNWLFDYRLKEGTHRAFAGLVRRAKYMNDPEPAYKTFLDNYDALQNLYQVFIKDAFTEVGKELANLKSV